MSSPSTAVDQHQDAQSTVSGHPSKSWRSCMRFIGPGYMVAVGYMDPGNWATDISGGAEFGYRLLSVVLLSSVVAVFFQLLCIKLGVVTGLDLAQQCRQCLPKHVNFILYLLAEVAIMATDLAEVIGSVIALQLLFGIPPLVGVLLTCLDVLIIMRWWGKKYQTFYEGGILLLIIAVAGCFITLLTYTKPDFYLVLDGLRPTTELFTNSKMLFLATAILGATVMPHNLYLHASICQHRRIESEYSLAANGDDKEADDHYDDDNLNTNSVGHAKDEEQLPSSSSSDSLNTLDNNDQQNAIVNVLEVNQPLLTKSSSLLPGFLISNSPNDDLVTPAAVPYASTKLTLRYAFIDTLVALTFAFFINATILVVGASAFWARDVTDLEELPAAYYSLQKYVGQVAATLFAVALLASGQSSTVTGTLAGQIIMSGFLRLQLRPVVRRLLTRILAILPAVITILISGEAGMNRLLILSQVVLSFQLPFAIIPLVAFTCSKGIMGGRDKFLWQSRREGDLEGMRQNGGERFANGWIMTAFGVIFVVIVSALNINLAFTSIFNDF